ncbi:MAG: glycerol-3-phosphate acyltransferase [Candidatus Hermodarchaeota archaeon]
MDVIELILSILSLIIGYLLGAILPAFLFGKLKGIDIREEGDKNPGTTNAFRVLGLPFAILTAIYDTLKGLLAMLVAFSLGVNLIFWQIAGLMVIIGHVFPFYLKFRGGQGNATATGLLLFYLVNYLFISLNLFYVLILLLVLVLIFTYISRAGTLLPVILFPILGYSVFIIYPTSGFNLFFVLILVHIGTVGMYKVITEKKLVIKDEAFLSSWWRVAIRPVSLLFLVFVFIDYQLGLSIIGIVCLCFIALDIFRFLHKRTNILLTEKVKAIFRKGEERRFSTMTLFLIATFLTVLFFTPIENGIAITALSFLVFGDMFAKIFGLAYGRHKIFDKTLEGTLAFIGVVIGLGYILNTSLDIHLLVLISGGIAAPLIELLPIGINDNFSVPLISGAVMTAIQLFFFVL